MLKKSFFIIGMVWQTLAFAQITAKADAGRIIKFLAADSMLKNKVPVKNQLVKLLSDKKQTALRLVLTGADSATNNTTTRWLAAKQQLNLYRIDVSSIVSKYIGETEKNLEQVFNKAEDKNWILFFDEADALFGQRGATEKDNSAAVNYFLQRLAGFKGTVLIHCKGDDCFGKLVKQSFVKIIAAP